MPNCQEHQRQEVRQILVPEETKSFEDVSTIESKQFYQNENLLKKVLFFDLKRNAKEKIHFVKTIFNTEVAEWNIGITKLSTDLGRDSIWLPLSRQCQETTLQRQMKQLYQQIQDSDEIWLIRVYWWVEGYFSTVFVTKTWMQLTNLRNTFK